MQQCVCLFVFWDSIGKFLLITRKLTEAIAEHGWKLLLDNWWKDDSESTDNGRPFGFRKGHYFLDFRLCVVLRKSVSTRLALGITFKS